jgi:hypothetical protein
MLRLELFHKDFLNSPAFTELKYEHIGNININEQAICLADVQLYSTFIKDDQQ